MFKSMKRWWKYLTAKLNSSFEEKADPKVQLEQAIAEAQDQHRRLREQAAVLMADEAGKAGNTAKAEEYGSAAEAFANRLIALEHEIEETKSLALQSTQASEQAKAAVAQNSAALQKKLAERQKLLSQLDQAKMQETMNKAMATISETVGEDVPTFDQVRDKIEARYAKAKGMSELTGESVESRMLEVEHASMNVEAQARLSEIRTQLGLAPSAEDGQKLLDQAAELKAEEAKAVATPAEQPAPQPQEG
jgi:phage shock protein A